MVINLENNRAIIIVGKPGTGKSYQAKKILGDNPIFRYANEYDIEDPRSIPIDRGILIEEVHYAPNTKLIKETLLNYRGKIVLTSNNQKDVPKLIYNMCKLKRAGTVNKSQLDIKTLAPNSDDPFNYEASVFDITKEWMNNPIREDVISMMKINKPFDEYMLSLMMHNVPSDKLAWIDSKVKRKWSQNYFYEILSYASLGNHHGGMQTPRKITPHHVPLICRRLGLRAGDSRALKQMLLNDNFKSYVATVLNQKQLRTLGITKIPKPKQVVERVKENFKTLDEWI